MFAGCNVNVEPTKRAYSTFSQEEFGELPVVRIDTQNKAYPSSKEEYVNCSFTLENAGENNFSVSMKSNTKDEDSVGIRRRGNTTYSMPKKAFRVKFDKKKSVLGMTKAKSYVLLADYLDQGKIRNFSAFSMAKYFDGLGFTPTPNHIMFFLNDEFWGVYLLVEQVDENAGRTNLKTNFEVSENGNYPFLVEMSNDLESGNDTFCIDDYISPFEIKYPESDERELLDGQDVVLKYIKDYITAMQATISNSTSQTLLNGQSVKFSDIVDEDAFIDYFLVNELMLNLDNIWKSLYFYKTKDGKVVFGPIWDFDFSLTDVWTGSPYDKSAIECADAIYIMRLHCFFHEYLQDEANYQKVVERWNLAYEKLTNKTTGINAYLKDYKHKIRNQSIEDAKYWYGTDGAFQFDMQYDYVRLFLIDRIQFLNNTFALNYNDFLQKIN